MTAETVMTVDPQEIAEVARRVIAECTERGVTVATGESVTSGAVAAALGSVPGASAVLRGGIVAYQVDLKTRLLDVDAAALSEGIVSLAVAESMASGAAQRCGSDFGVGTTGAAGPMDHDGAPAGTAAWAVWSPSGVRSEKRVCAGDRHAIQRRVVLEALLLLELMVREYSGSLRR